MAGVMLFTGILGGSVLAMGFAVGERIEAFAFAFDTIRSGNIRMTSDLDPGAGMTGLLNNDDNADGATNIILEHQYFDPERVFRLPTSSKAVQRRGKPTWPVFAGPVFCDMGFLSASEVIECSASHLIGRFMGHTGPQVPPPFLIRVWEGSTYSTRRAACAGEAFEDEAVAELVDCVTKPAFHKNTVVVLAGYDKDMDTTDTGSYHYRARL
ncbi:hypothetical protein F4775DRAFT_592050 [Biscogniauxia sp. FL1348]|nr:hypothetical protein F4775DRAFT_592050 [Biscogniauxia sp. FL1348]